MSDNLTPWEKYKQNLGDTRPWDLLDKDNYIDEKTARKRYSICLICPELIQLTKQCKKCGCFMSAKTRLENAKCPMGKW